MRTLCSVTDGKPMCWVQGLRVPVNANQSA